MAGDNRAISELPSNAEVKRHYWRARDTSLPRIAMLMSLRL